MIEILDVKDAEPKKLDITPELALAAYNTLIQFCRQQEGKQAWDVFTDTAEKFISNCVRTDSDGNSTNPEQLH